MALSRRGFLLGLAAGIAAPAIVKAANIMPVRNRLIEPTNTAWWVNNVGIWPGLHGDLTAADIVHACDEMKRHNILPAPDGTYHMIVPSSTINGFKREFGFVPRIVDRATLIPA